MATSGCYIWDWASLDVCIYSSSSVFVVLFLLTKVCSAAPSLSRRLAIIDVYDDKDHSQSTQLSHIYLLHLSVSQLLKMHLLGNYCCLLHECQAIHLHQFPCHLQIKIQHHAVFVTDMKHYCWNMDDLTNWPWATLTSSSLAGLEDRYSIHACIIKAQMLWGLCNFEELIFKL